MKLYVMDAFANRIFGGNQAGVALPDRELSDETMRQIAAEMKHSETAFIHMEPDGSVSLRYFTPAGEVDLCGHATLAAAGFEPVQQPAFHGGAGFPVFSDVLCTRRTDIYIPGAGSGKPKTGPGRRMVRPEGLSC